MSKPVLIHVPKCAGSSMVRLLWLDYAGHSTYEETVEVFGPDRFYFSVVRHPVDRFISCMAVVYQNKENYPLPVFMGLEAHLHFKGFVETTVDFLMRDLIDFNLLEPIQRVLFRSMSEQLKDLPDGNWIKFEDAIGNAFTVFSPDGPYTLDFRNIQHLGECQIPKPKLSNETIKLIEEYYREDMNRFGYASKVKS